MSCMFLKILHCLIDILALKYYYLNYILALKYYYLNSVLHLRQVQHLLLFSQQKHMQE